MAIVTPDDFIEWATRSDADTALPDASETTDGYVVGDSPASSHVNYILNRSSEWASFVPRVLPSAIAFGNIEYETGAPVTTTPWGRTSPTFFTVMLIRGRWYAWVGDSSNDLNVFDSVDGETWSAQLNIVAATDDNEVTRTDRVGRGCPRVRLRAELVCVDGQHRRDYPGGRRAALGYDYRRPRGLLR